MFLFYLNKFKWVFVVLGGLSSFYAIATYFDSRGYNRAVSEIQRESADKIAKATGEAIKSAEIKIQEALERQRILFDGELERAENERVVEIKFKEIIREVEKIVYVESDCHSISEHGVRLLNKAVNNANRTTPNKRGKH